MIIPNSIGIAIAILFVLFILHKKQKRTSDYCLIIINVILAMTLYTDILMNQEPTANVFFIQSLMSFYFFPSFMVYGMLAMSSSNTIKRSWWWFFIYAVAFTIFMILDFTVINTYDTPERVREVYESPPLSYHFFYKSHKLFIVGGLLWYLRQLRRYDVRIKEKYSLIEPIRLKWLKHFAWIYMALNLIALFTFLAYNFGLIFQGIDTAFMVLNICITLTLFYMSFNGIRQYTLAEFYAIQAKDTEPSKVATPPTNKYRTSSLKADDMTAIHQSFLSLFEQEKIYLEPKLQLQEVASRLKVTTHALSQTINSIEKKPFYDVVNTYRVSHFKNLLVSPIHKQYTILALGLESGFNSKASLNRIFKQQTGQSPREFQKSHLPDNKAHPIV